MRSTLLISPSLPLPSWLHAEESLALLFIGRFLQFGFEFAFWVSFRPSRHREHMYCLPQEATLWHQRLAVPPLLLNVSWGSGSLWEVADCFVCHHFVPVSEWDKARHYISFLMPLGLQRIDSLWFHLLASSKTCCSVPIGWFNFITSATLRFLIFKFEFFGCFQLWTIFVSVPFSSSSLCLRRRPKLPYHEVFVDWFFFLALQLRYRGWFLFHWVLCISCQSWRSRICLLSVDGVVLKELHFEFCRPLGLLAGFLYPADVE